jgi:hypothetical protein
MGLIRSGKPAISGINSIDLDLSNENVGQFIFISILNGIDNYNGKLVVY